MGVSSSRVKPSYGDARSALAMTCARCSGQRLALPLNSLGPGSRNILETQGSRGRICRYETCRTASGPRAEEGERGAPRPAPPRRPSAARLRDREADRGALGRRPPLQRRVPLPAPLSAGEEGPRGRALGGEGRAAAAPVLPPHRAREVDAEGAAEPLPGVRPRAEPRHGGRAFLDGRTRAGRALAAWN